MHSAYQSKANRAATRKMERIDDNDVFISLVENICISDRAVAVGEN